MPSLTCIKNHSPSAKLLNLKNSKVIPLKKYGKSRNVGLGDRYQTTSGDVTPINGIPSNGITGMYMQIKSKESSNFYDTSNLAAKSNFKMDDNNFGVVDNAQQVRHNDDLSHTDQYFDKTSGTVEEGQKILIYYK